MDNLMLISLWGLLGLSCGMVSIVLTYRNLQHSRALLAAWSADVDKDLRDFIQQRGREELEQTQAGRELLRSLNGEWTGQPRPSASGTSEEYIVALAVMEEQLDRLHEQQQAIVKAIEALKKTKQPENRRTGYSEATSAMKPR